MNVFFVVFIFLSCIYKVIATKGKREPHVSGCAHVRLIQCVGHNKP